MYPYGREIYGYLHHETVLGCQSFSISSVMSNIDLPYFILLEEGECSARMKAHNTEKAGGAILIIYKNLDPLDDELLNINDMTQITINIPTLVISNEDGENLKKIIRQNGDFKMKF